MKGGRLLSSREVSGKKLNEEADEAFSLEGFVVLFLGGALVVGPLAALRGFYLDGDLRRGFRWSAAKILRPVI